MQFTQVIPAEITNLPKYSVPLEIFICTTIALIIFVIISIVFLVIWIWKIYKGIYNPDYMIDYEVKYQTMKAFAIQNQNDEYAEVNKKQINIDDIPQFVQFNRKQARLLEFMCVAVIVAINIGTFTCGIMEIVLFVISLILFLLFNVLRLIDFKILRLVWLITMLIAYLPFYIFKKSLETA